MNCRECEELIVEALYGELDQQSRGRFDDHVESCPDCARAFTKMRATLNVADARVRTDPGHAYWDGYWNRLTARMEREEIARRERGWLKRLLPGLSAAGTRWAYRGAVAALLIVFGAVVGRVVLPGAGDDRIVVTESIPETPSLQRDKKETVAVGRTDEIDAPSPAEEKAREADAPATGRSSQPIRTASAEACARQYIEDSQVLLLALVNFEPGVEGEYLADWSTQKNRSRALVNQAASIKGDLDDPKQRRLRALVTELEMILLQIANLETTGDLEAVEMIRGSVKDRDVMLKINLEKLRSNETEKPAPGACDA